MTPSAGGAGTTAQLTRGWRLAVGTLTVLRVRATNGVTPAAAGTSMVLAPMVGGLLALGGAGLLWLLGWGPPGLWWPGELVPSALAAVLTLAAMAVLTRGLHLDGLADTADGWGSGGSADRSLAVMRQGDVGPFGVVTLVLALLLQVTALAAVTAERLGPLAVATALVTGRLALPLACRRGVPAARPDGLGAAFAGSVGPGGLAVAGLLAAALLGGAAGLTGATSADHHVLPLLAAVAVALVAGLAMAEAVLRRTQRRFGGVTGDVLGACVETAATVALVVLVVAT